MTHGITLLIHLYIEEVTIVAIMVVIIIVGTEVTTAADIMVAGMVVITILGMVEVGDITTMADHIIAMVDQLRVDIHQMEETLELVVRQAVDTRVITEVALQQVALAVQAQDMELPMVEVLAQLANRALALEDLAMELQQEVVVEEQA